MWGFRWKSFAARGAFGAARRCLTCVGFLSYLLDETEGRGSRALAECFVGPRDSRPLSLSTGIGPSGADEQRANSFGSERAY